MGKLFRLAGANLQTPQQRKSVGAITAKRAAYHVGIFHLKNIFLVLFVFGSQLAKGQAQLVAPPIGSRYLESSVNYCDQNPFKLVFADEFNGTTLNTNNWYTYYPYGANGSDACEFCRTHGEGEAQIYKDQNVTVSNGTVKLTAMPENGAWYGVNRSYSSGMIHSKQDFTTYGKYEIRCKLPPGKGFFPAFWTSGGKQEIDIFEFGEANNQGYYTDGHYCAQGAIKYVATSGSLPSGSTAYGQDCNTTFSLATGWVTHCKVLVPGNFWHYNPNVNYTDGNWHTFAIEYGKVAIYYYIDGVLTYTFNKYFTPNGQPLTDCVPPVTGGYPFHPAFPIAPTSMRVIANLALDGPYTSAPTPNQYQPYTASNPKMEIDYIRVYQRTPQAGLSDLCIQTVTGDDFICNTTQNYTYQYSGVFTVTNWTLSNNLTLVSSTSNSVTVKANSLVPGTASVQANFALGASPCTNSVKKDFWIGGVTPLSFSTSQPFCQEPDANIRETSSNPASSTYNWTTQVNNGTTNSFVGGKDIIVSGVYGQNNTIRYSLTVSNSCGITASSGIKTTSTRKCTGSGPTQWRTSVSPNPAKNTFQIEIITDSETQEDVQEFSKKIAIFDGTMQPIYNADIYENKIQINTETWKNGLYFIQIMSENGEYTTEKIVIEN